MTATTLAPSARRARELVLSICTEGPATVVALQGEADVVTLALVKTTLDRVARDYAGPVVIELAETTFIDSATIRAVTDTGRALDTQGRLLTVRSPSPTALRLLELFAISNLAMPGGGGIE
ncbi:MAG: STAS domain-containing protein [Acidimicrobiales bacterium]